MNKIDTRLGALVNNVKTVALVNVEQPFTDFLVEKMQIGTPGSLMEEAARTFDSLDRFVTYLGNYLLNSKLLDNIYSNLVNNLF